MQNTEFAVIILGTLVFFGFAIWMAFHSRRTADAPEYQDKEL